MINRERIVEVEWAGRPETTAYAVKLLAGTENRTGMIAGITGAISGITPEKLEKGISGVTDGLALAFDATALALAAGVTTLEIVKRALSEPARWIALNAGVEGSVVVAKIATLPAGHGYNAATGEYGDLMAQGIIDPVKVTRSAVQNAASIAGMLLTTETLVVEKPEEEKASAGDGHGHGHSH